MTDEDRAADNGLALADPPAEETRGKVILLLDGVRLFLQLEETLLQRAEWTVRSATTAAEAFEILERERVDLVLMDYVLPDMNGHEVVRRIKQDPRTADTAICIVTARGMREHVDRCMAAGCASFLFKPVTRQALGDRVRELLSVPIRRHVRTLVRINVNAQFHERFFFGNTINLSAGGILLESPLDLALGESIHLRFFLPGDTAPVNASARVVRRGHSEHSSNLIYGMSFEGLAPIDRERMEDFISQQAAAVAEG